MGTQGLFLIITEGLFPTLSEPACFDLLRLRLLHPSDLFPLVEASRRRVTPSSLLFSVWFGLRQPERDMGGLHRLLHHGHQLLAQLSQVKLIAQRSTEGLDDFGCIILAPVEATIDD